MTIITPTAKGHELYNKYYNILLFSYNDCIPEDITKILAKKCSTIAIRQVLDSMSKDYDAFNKDEYEFWKEVLNTIDEI